MQRRVTETIASQDQGAAGRLPECHRHLARDELEPVGADEVQELEQQQAVVRRPRGRRAVAPHLLGELPPVVYRTIEHQHAVRQRVDVGGAPSHTEVDPSRGRPVRPHRTAVRQPQADGVQLVTAGVAKDAVHCSHSFVLGQMVGRTVP